MDSKLSLCLLRVGLGLCFTLLCAPLAVSQTDTPGVPEATSETYPGFYGEQLSQGEKSREDSILAFLKEVKGIKIAELTLKEATLQDALEKLQELIPPNHPYLREIKMTPDSKSSPVSISLINAELGKVILTLGAVSDTFITEREGVVTFSSEWTETQPFAFKIKTETAKQLGLPQDPANGQAYVKEELWKWKTGFESARYSPAHRLLIVGGTPESVELLRSLIYFLEQGAVISFPE